MHTKRTSKQCFHCSVYSVLHIIQDKVQLIIFLNHSFYQSYVYVQQYALPNLQFYHKTWHSLCKQNRGKIIARLFLILHLQIWYFAQLWDYILKNLKFREGPSLPKQNSSSIVQLDVPTDIKSKQNCKMTSEKSI